MEHYLELYATQNVVSNRALKAILVLDELDAELTEEELSKAIDFLSTDKAPGDDGIHPENKKSGWTNFCTRCSVCVGGRAWL